MKALLYAFVLSLMVGGTSQAQEAKKMEGKEHKIAEKMDHKAKAAKDDKAKMDKKMKKS